MPKICYFKPHLQKCPFEHLPDTAFLNIFNNHELIEEIQQRFGFQDRDLPKSFRVCSHHFKTGSIVEVNYRKRLKPNARLDWSTLELESSSRNDIKDDEDAIKNFDDLILGLAMSSTVDTSPWKQRWKLFEDSDMICFHRIQPSDDLSNISITFKVLVKRRELSVNVYKGECLADASELDWILINCKLEKWNQLWSILQHYSSEPAIKKSPKTLQQIQKAFDNFDQFRGSQSVNNLIREIKEKQKLFEELVSGDISQASKPLIMPFDEIKVEMDDLEGTDRVEDLVIDTPETSWCPREKSEFKSEEANELSKSPTQFEMPFIPEITLTTRKERSRSQQPQEAANEQIEGVFFKCDRCGKAYATRRKFQFHFYSSHLGEVVCDKCGKKFRNRHALKAHSEIHLDPQSRTIKCPQCDVRLLPCSLKRHIRTTHEGWKGHLCRHCGATFTTIASVRQHETAHFKNALDDLSKRCPLCSRVFNKVTAGIIEKHIKKCSEGREKRSFTYPCSFCERKFFTKILAAQHMGLKHDFHIKDPKNFCFECQKEVEDPQNHSRLHNCKFVCDFCGIRLTSQIKLDNHVTRSHGNGSEDRPFKCEKCSSSFKSNNHLQSHITCVHLTESEKKFECEICNKRFGLKCHLNSHMNSLHAEVKRFACNYCGEMFKKINTMKNHCRLKHNEECAYPCPDCPEKMRTLNDLKKHREKKHGETILVHKYHTV